MQFCEVRNVSDERVPFPQADVQVGEIIVVASYQSQREVKIVALVELYNKPYVQIEYVDNPFYCAVPADEIRRLGICDFPYRGIIYDRSGRRVN